MVCSEIDSVEEVDIARAKHSLSSSSSLSSVMVMVTHCVLSSSVIVSEPLASVKSSGAT